jgi:hypothetical protein
MKTSTGTLFVVGADAICEPVIDRHKVNFLLFKHYTAML